jgi:hypothetical protein
MKKCYFELGKKYHDKINERAANWIGHILCRNCSLKRVTEGKTEGWIEMTEDGEEDVGNYWMTLTKREDGGN